MPLMFSKAIAEPTIPDSFSISYLEREGKDNEAAYRLTYNRIMLIKSGHGVLHIDDQAFSISGNEVFLIAKGQICRLQPGSHFTGYELLFGDCFWEKAPASASNCKAVLFNDASANQQLPLGDNGHTELNILFETLHQEFSKADYINKLDALAAYLKIIMIKMANINAALANGYDSFENQLYRHFLELVSQQYQQSHEVANYARLLGVSARKLTDLTKRCSGKGAKDLINGQLIAEAKRSLQFSALPVKEIAFKLNFSTPEQFSHFFKKNAQLSPQDFRTRFVNIGM
jgi:AraC family transcriptional activator of pobA